MSDWQKASPTPGCLHSFSAVAASETETQDSPFAVLQDALDEQMRGQVLAVWQTFVPIPRSQQASPPAVLQSESRLHCFSHADTQTPCMMVVPELEPPEPELLVEPLDAPLEPPPELPSSPEPPPSRRLTVWVEPEQPPIQAAPVSATSAKDAKERPLPRCIRFS